MLKPKKKGFRRLFLHKYQVFQRKNRKESNFKTDHSLEQLSKDLANDDFVSL